MNEQLPDGWRPQQWQPQHVPEAGQDGEDAVQAHQLLQGAEDAQVGGQEDRGRGDPADSSGCPQFPFREYLQLQEKENMDASDVGENHETHIHITATGGEGGAATAANEVEPLQDPEDAQGEGQLSSAQEQGRGEVETSTTTSPSPPHRWRANSTSTSTTMSTPLLPAGWRATRPVRNDEYWRKAWAGSGLVAKPKPRTRGGLRGVGEGEAAADADEFRDAQGRPVEPLKFLAQQ